MTRYLPNHVALAALECQRLLFPNIMPRNAQRITPDAAAFLFSAVSRLRIASLTTHALFRVYKPIPPMTAAGIGMHLAKAIIQTVGPMNSSDLRWNLISYNFIIAPHERTLRAHLDDPENFPCPAYALS